MNTLLKRYTVTVRRGKKWGGRLTFNNVIAHTPTQAKIKAMNMVARPEPDDKYYAHSGKR